MKRKSLEYVDYLEAVVLSLLAEREFLGQTGGFIGSVNGREGLPVTYDPAYVKREVAHCRSQVAKIRWAEQVEGHGFCIGVPADLAQQARPGEWVEIDSRWTIEVVGTLMSKKGPCLILSNAFEAVVDQDIKAGMVVVLD